ncbi:MAG: hypothetical protein LBN98_05735 [Prevotellaceae bacterium]|jgi:hypothetical protein|nr:hypothetical protein [Prevotellaceae bacterium]
MKPVFKTACCGLLLAAAFWAMPVYGQEKKVAMLEPIVKGGAVAQIEKDIILAALEAAITAVPGYRAFTRLDVNQITKELSFQQSGMVDDDQRKRIGVMSGASLICISQLTAGTNILIKSSLVDVETGEIVNTANQLMKKDEIAIYEGCSELATKMLGNSSASASSLGDSRATAPAHAASAKTWKFGDQTWSDVIQIPDCNKSSFTKSNTEPQCRSYTEGGRTYYYYNWAYVHAHAANLCPSPWRVPSKTDFEDLKWAATGNDLAAAWGYGGLANGSSLDFVSSNGYYWSATAYSSNSAYCLQYNRRALGVYYFSKNIGFQVRCVQ